MPDLYFERNPATGDTNPLPDPTYVGTKPGSLVAGGDPRLPIIAVAGIVSDGTTLKTDNAAAIQAALNQIPVGGALIKLPAGAFFSGPLTIPTDRTCIFQGEGAGSVSNISGPGAAINAGFVPGGTTLYTNLTMGNFLSVNASGCTIRDLAIINTSTTLPTAGCGIYCAKATDMLFLRVNVLGFFTNVHVVNGYKWIMSYCGMYDPVNVGLWVEDVAAPDGGDSLVIGSTFSYYTKAAGNGLAAILFQSGGGLRVLASKVNGYTGAKFQRGVYASLSDGAATADLFVGMFTSIENVSGFAVELAQAGPNNNSGVENVMVQGLQTGVTGGGVKIGAGYINAFIVGNTFQGAAAQSIWLAGGDAAHVGENTHYACGLPLQIDSAVTNVSYVPQIVKGTLGPVVSDASTSADGRHDYVFRAPSFANGATTTACRLGVKNQTSGTITFTISGSLFAVGPYLIKGQRTYSWQGGGPVAVTTVGTDTVTGAANAGALTYAVDTAAVSGEMQIKITNSGSGAASSNCRLMADGPLGSFAVGP